MIEEGQSSSGAESSAAPRWKGTRSLDLVYQFNSRCLSLLGSSAAGLPLPEASAIADNRDLWAGMTGAARERAARLPFVILDFRFADDQWWRDITGTQSAQDPPPRLGDPGPKPLIELLAQETLMFAWQTARWDRLAAQLSFAMPASVVELIAELTPGRLNELASRESAGIRLRWGQDVNFWRELLLAAEVKDLGRVADLHLHAKLLLMRSLLAK